MSNDNNDQRISEMERLLHEIDTVIDDAMGEKLIGAKSLLSLSWARKLIARALKKPEI
jgi:hypothetical protein